MELHRIVIGIDSSDRSLHAARWAVDHFARGVEVVLVHAIAVPEPPLFMRARFPQAETLVQSATADATKRLRDAARSLRAHEARLEVRVGNAAKAIADVAREVGADAIVVGKHGDHPGVLHRLGTTADRLVRIAPAPVLLATGLRDAVPRRILVALDDADTTPNVVAWTRLLATRFHADIAAVHVVTSAILSHVAAGGCRDRDASEAIPSSIRAEVTDHAVTWMNGLFDGTAPTPRLTTEVGFGLVANEIVAAAERHNSELIVLGRTGAGLGRWLRIGSVARHVLHTARCPVLVVPEPEDAIIDATGAR